MTATPWGNSDHTRRMAKGITFYGTPSHGGIRVTPKAAEGLSAAALAEAEVWGNAYWFEEDCTYALVLHEKPELGTPPRLEELMMNFPLYLERRASGYEGPKVGDKYEAASDMSFGKGRTIPKGTKLTYQGTHKLRPLFSTNTGFRFTASMGAVEAQ
jgi:hypothetical protein